jgi:MFS family permease
MLHLISQYRGLPRQIYILLLARIVVAMSSFVYPFLTLFLSSRIGMSETQIGKYLFVLALLYIPAALIGGKLADRFSRKWVYFGAMILADIAFFFTGFCYEQAYVIYILIAGFFFINMGYPVLSAMMMDLTRPDNRQESYSLVYLGYNLGFAFGPLIAGLLFENYTRWIFWGEAFLNLCAMILIAIFIKDTLPDESEIAAIACDESRAKEIATGESLFKSLLHTPVVIFFAVFAAFYAFAYSQLGFVLPLHMEDLFGIGSGSKYYGVVWSLNGVMVFLLTPVAVLILKKKNPLFNLSLAGICLAAGIGLYSVIAGLAFFYLLAVVWSAGEVIAVTNTGVFIADHSPISHRARYQSVFDIIQGSGRAMGPMIIGAYLMGHTYADAWRLVGVLCLVASLAFLIIYKIVAKKETPSNTADIHTQLKNYI